MSYQNNEVEKPSFARRFFRALFRTILILVLLALLVVGGYYGVRELQRSFDSVATRIERNRRDINTLQKDLNALVSGSPEQQQQIAELEEQVGEIDGRLQTLTDDLAQQQRSLRILTDSVGTQTEGLETNAAELAALQSALVALQGDVNENTTQIDTLGGEIDGIRGEVGALSEDVENATGNVSAIATRAGAAVMASRNTTAELTQLSQTLVLFRAWGFVSRARFRLLEGNAGLVATDVQGTLNVIDGLRGQVSDAEVEALDRASDRLNQALAALPDNPTGAALDLERAWDELGAMIGRRLPVAEAAPAEAGTITVTPTAEGTESTEEAEETGQEATPTLSATVSPTPPPPTVTPQATPTAYP